MREDLARFSRDLKELVDSVQDSTTQPRGVRGEFEVKKRWCGRRRAR